jgi:hypothetical protein
VCLCARVQHAPASAARTLEGALEEAAQRHYEAMRAELTGADIDLDMYIDAYDDGRQCEDAVPVDVLLDDLSDDDNDDASNDSYAEVADVNDDDDDDDDDDDRKLRKRARKHDAPSHAPLLPHEQAAAASANRDVPTTLPDEEAIAHARAPTSGVSTRAHHAAGRVELPVESHLARERVRASHCVVSLLCAC